MAIKDINDLTRPLSDLVGEQGEKAARRKKQLAEVRATRAAGMTADEAKAAAERGDFGEVGQGEERMDFLATPLVTPTDFNLAYNEPGALDYADRIDDSKKTKKPSLINRAIRTGIMLAGPGKFRIPLNLAMNAPEFIGGLLKKGSRRQNIGKELEEVLEDIGQEKLLTFNKQTDLVKFINDKYGLGITKGNLSRKLKNSKFKIGSKEYSQEFLDFAENNKKLIDKTGKPLANDSLEALLKLDKDTVLKFKSSDFVDYLNKQGIKIKDNQTVDRIRNIYKKFIGAKAGFSKVEADFSNPIVYDIFENIRLGNITKNQAAKQLDDFYNESGLTGGFSTTTVTASRAGRSGEPVVVASNKFNNSFDDFLNQLPEGVSKKILREGTGADAFNKTKIGEIIPPKARKSYVKELVVFDDTGKSFSQVKRSILKDKITTSIINNTKNLFKDKNSKIFEIDHVQAPRFGGTNLESNLRLITKADHTALKMLPTSKTLASDVVKAKTGFENEYYKLSTKLIDNVKKNNFEAADKIAESLRVLTNNFKNTYKNTDFIVGQPHVAIKTGDKTAKYIKYSDNVKLTNKQKKYIEDNNLLPEQSNLPNANKPLQKQAEDIYQGYLQIYNLIGEIPKNIKLPGQKSISVIKDFSSMRDGGIVDIFKMTRPLNAQR